MQDIGRYSQLILLIIFYNELDVTQTGGQGFQVSDDLFFYFIRFIWKLKMKSVYLEPN